MRTGDCRPSGLARDGRASGLAMPSSISLGPIMIQTVRFKTILVSAA